MEFQNIALSDGEPTLIFELELGDDIPDPIIGIGDGCLKISEQRCGRWYKFHPQDRNVREIINAMVDQERYLLAYQQNETVFTEYKELTDVEVDSLNRL